jgi:acetyl-CoA synthetase
MSSLPDPLPDDDDDDPAEGAGAASAGAPTASPARSDAHAELHGHFRWHVPERFNIAEACCHRWARETPNAVAVTHVRENGQRAELNYGTLARKARRLSHALERLGIEPGDRVAVVLPQRPHTAVALVAIFQMGAIAVPLSTLFGPEALEHRLRDSGAKVAIVDVGSLPTLQAMRDDLPQLGALIVAGKGERGEGERTGEIDWNAAIEAERPSWETVDTAADDPAILIYTSGTTGPAKGALIPHRALLGNLPGFVASQNWFRAGKGPFWSPADWAWTGGLMDALLPTLYFGRRILAVNGRFDPEKALALMEKHGVTHTFLFPTALKAMMRTVPEPRARHPKLALKAIMSAGEAVGDAVFAYCRDKLGVVPNEMFGQTEVNYVVGNCGSWVDGAGQVRAGWPARPGSMGRPYPGHRVEVIDDEGHVCLPGMPGDIAVHPRDIHGDRDPIFFLGYWGNEGATAAKFTDTPFESWCRTGDRGMMDEDGYFWYLGRSDDQFKSSGYRIGPAEIEACLARHPAVSLVAVVPKPDAERGAVVKAFVVLAAGVTADPELVAALQQQVRSQLAPYETPKDIEFVDALPMTTTGKVQRNVLRQLEIDRANAATSAG